MKDSVKNKNNQWQIQQQLVQVITVTTPWKMEVQAIPIAQVLLKLLV
jgi:hypothetical protein